MRLSRSSISGLLLILLLSAFQSLPASRAPVRAVKPTEEYLKVLPQPGDDVTTLLERYDLDGYDCNIDQFFKINNLQEDYRLKTKTAYKIPVMVITYNGKSIRSTLNIDDWQTALRISEYNKNAVTRKLRVETFEKDKQLWVPWHELHCPAQGELAVAAAAAKKQNLAAGAYAEATFSRSSRVFPIFGNKYAKTPLIDQKLRGKVFYLISGHGGPDCGAQGSRSGHTLCEDEYAYDVSLRLLRLLVGHGATAYMIVRDPNDGIRDEQFLNCDNDEIVWGDRVIPLDQKERLGQRTDLINALTEKNRKAGVTDQTIIEIHVDSRVRDKKIDVFFYYRNGSESSKELALHFHKTFMQKYLKTRSQRQYNGSVSTRNLYTLRETTTPTAVYIELGNIHNDWDQQRIVIASNRQAVANWLCGALLAR